MKIPCAEIRDALNLQFDVQVGDKELGLLVRDVFPNITRKRFYILHFLHWLKSAKSLRDIAPTIN